MQIHEPQTSGTIEALDPEADKANRINHLVGEARALHANIELLNAQLALRKAELVKLPPGMYFDLAGQSVTVVGAGKAIKPGEGGIVAARKIAAALAGKLFTRHVVYKPVKGLREIALALLTPKKAEKLLALCEVPTKPQVRF